MVLTAWQAPTQHLRLWGAYARPNKVLVQCECLTAASDLQMSWPLSASRCSVSRPHGPAQCSSWSRTCRWAEHYLPGMASMAAAYYTAYRVPPVLCTVAQQQLQHQQLSNVRHIAAV